MTAETVAAVEPGRMSPPVALSCDIRVFQHQFFMETGCFANNVSQSFHQLGK